MNPAPTEPTEAEKSLVITLVLNFGQGYTDSFFPLIRAHVAAEAAKATEDLIHALTVINGMPLPRLDCMISANMRLVAAKALAACAQQNPPT